MLADIAEVNRIQAENGLPTLNSSAVGGTKETSEIVGRILKAPGHGVPEPFHQTRNTNVQ